MTTPLKLPASEWAWVHATLLQVGKRMPSPGGAARVGYRANEWDLDDLYETARSAVCFDGDRIWTAVEARARDGVWPKVKGDEARMLRARWKAAQEFAAEVLRLANEKSGEIPPPQEPANSEQVMKALLLDCWDAFLVDRWLSKNLPGLIYWDHYRDGWEPTSEYFEWERQVESGTYERKI